MHNKIIILAGGVSSRMKKSEEVQELSRKDIDQANARSKGLIGVGENGRPFVDYLLYDIKLAGYSEVYIVISPTDELFREFYGEKENTSNLLQGLDIQFAVQHVPQERAKPMGTADALLQALQQHPELQRSQFTVCNSDNLYSVEALLALRNTSSPNALISYNRDDLQFPTDQIERFAVMRVDSEGFLVDIVEKPSPEQILEYRDNSGNIRVNMNAFKFDGKMLYYYLENCPFDPIRNEKELPIAMLNMSKNHPQSVVAIPFSEHVPDLTAKKDIASVREYLKEHYEELNLKD